MSKATPPLLMLAQGRKPRPRRAPVDRPKEIALHMSVAKLLRDYARADWQWTHVGHGELRDKRTAGKLKQMGAKPGWPDFILVPPRGQLHCLELKRLGEDLSETQEAFQLWCIRHDVPHSGCRSIEEVLALFEAWGCLSIKLAETTKRPAGGANNPAGLGGKSGKTEADIVNVDNVNVDKDERPERPTGNSAQAGLRTRQKHAAEGAVRKGGA